MKIGTKTILLGNHLWWLHSFFVYVAWVRLYKRLPNFYETICIIIHDWGYWGKPNLDGAEGEDHPRWAAEWIHILTGNHYYWELCMFHSRFQAKRYHNSLPSKLCLADKFGVAMMPVWLWVFLGSLSGEIAEYMADTKYEINNCIAYKPYKSPAEFFRAYKVKCAEWAKTGDLTIGSTQYE